MFKSKIVSCLLILSACASFSVFAQSLRIDNQTDHDSTAVINSGACSASYPGGITRAHTANDVPETLLRALCGNKTCKADIYMNASCSGAPIGTAYFNVKTGLGDITVDPKYGYSFARNGAFSVVIMGGPAG